MMNKLRLHGLKTSLVMLCLMITVFSSILGFAAEQLDFRKDAGNFSVYLVVMPTEFIVGPQRYQEPGARPFQPPSAQDMHHVMVSLFEHPSGRRVVKATVTARVAALGFSGDKKELAPTVVSGAAVFANSFVMIGRGPFRVDVEFRTPTSPRSEHATFYFSHPTFSNLPQ